MGEYVITAGGGGEYGSIIMTLNSTQVKLLTVIGEQMQDTDAFLEVQSVENAQLSSDSWELRSARAHAERRAVREAIEHNGEGVSNA